MYTEMADKYAELSASSPISSDSEVVQGRKRPRKRVTKKQGGAKNVSAKKKTTKKGAISMTPESAQTWEKMRGKRQERIEEAIAQLPEKDVRDILVQVSLQHAGIFHSVVEAAMLKNNPPPEDPDPLPEDNPWWCQCTRCRWMSPPPHPAPGDVDELDINDTCCAMIPEDCLSIMPEFDAFCLDPMSLQMNILYRGDVFGLQATTQMDINKSRRHAAYRLFIMWRHGRLNKNQRIVVPSCCVLKIRDRYISPTGHYTGFKPGTMF